MDYTDVSDTSADAGGILDGDVLPVMWREPLSEQLLYALALSPHDEGELSLPVVDPQPLQRFDRPDGLDLGDWRAAWHAVWATYAAWDPTAHQETDVETSTARPTAGELVDRATGGLDFLDESFYTWGSQLPTGTANGVLSSEVGEVSGRALTRGLRGIFVLPVQGAWAHVEQERILLVSQTVADNPKSFVAALNEFGGVSGDR